MCTLVWPIACYNGLSLQRFTGHCLAESPRAHNTAREEKKTEWHSPLNDVSCLCTQLPWGSTAAMLHADLNLESSGVVITEIASYCYPSRHIVTATQGHDRCQNVVHLPVRLLLRPFPSL